MSFRQDAAHLQKLANNAFCQTGVLAALADGGMPDPDKLQRALEHTAAQFESAALEVRKLCERYSTGTGSYGSRPVLPPMEIAGSVELLGYNWLHITLNTLLPHCRFQPPEWLSDTIRRLLDEYEAQGCKLPFFNRALLVIDEFTGAKGRHILTRTIRAGRRSPTPSRAGSSRTTTSTPWGWRCCPVGARWTYVTSPCWI